MPTQSEMEAQYKILETTAGETSPVELFREWGKEVAPIACNNVYSRIEVDHENGTRTIQSGFQLREDLYYEWLGIAESLIHKAGQHVAFVLIDLLEHHKHKIAFKEGRGRHSRRKKWG